jgi:deoxyribose-phosphate aldolase
VELALHSSGVGTTCVVGFHEGTQSTEQKIAEGLAALSAGASELDIVINRELLIQKQYTTLYEELAKLRYAFDGKCIKLILETSQLSKRQTLEACVLAGHAFFDYIKTSTGFVGGGATVEDVKLMASIAEFMASPDGANLPKKAMLVKASGGVRSLETMQQMIEAGASRIGTSSGVKIMNEAAHDVGVGEVPPVAKLEAVEHGKNKVTDGVAPASGTASENASGGY